LKNKFIQNKFLVFIPARSGSKRIKNKNLKIFRGKPLIYWTLNNVNQSKIISNCILSTDSTKIINFSRKILKKKCIYSKRPKKLSTDKSKIVDVIYYEINKHKLQYFEYIVLLQPTSPLRKAKLLDQTLKKVINKKLSNLITVHNVLKTKVIKIKQKKIHKVEKERNFISGDIYIFKTKNFMKNKKIIYKKSNFFLSKYDFSDIDYLEEFNEKNY